MEDDETEHVNVVIDCGTSALSVAVNLAKGSKPIMGSFRVPFQNGQKHISPQGIAYYQDKIVWGYELECLVLDGKLPPTNVLYGLKLSLYEEYAQEPESRHLRQQLQALGKEEYDVFAELFLAVIEVAQAYLLETPLKMIRTREQILDLKVEVFILVPQCFSASGRATLAAALRIAKIERFQFLSESEAAMCAVSSMTREFLRRIDVSLSLNHYKVAANHD